MQQCCCVLLCAAAFCFAFCVLYTCTQCMQAHYSRVSRAHGWLYEKAYMFLSAFWAQHMQAVCMHCLRFLIAGASAAERFLLMLSGRESRLPSLAPGHSLRCLLYGLCAIAYVCLGYQCPQILCKRHPRSRSLPLASHPTPVQCGGADAWLCLRAQRTWTLCVLARC